jgi:hypothetical protein
VSVFQIIVLIWLTVLTLLIFKNVRAIAGLITLRLADPDLVNASVRELRRDNPDENPFLRAGIDAVKKHNKQEKGSQDG